MTGTINTVFLSELSKIEFASTLWKKVRTGEITAVKAEETLALFASDFGQYTFIAINSLIIEQACLLLSIYGMQGLRTLDSLQLATARSLAQQATLFITADKLLQSFFEAEGLPILPPAPLRQ